ncbi:MAG: glycosyltransferase family 2 protein [Patescibacteria group bacterium]|nr:glycosyltransferase family 2 protein [Patescibacteria group bacterium]
MSNFISVVMPCLNEKETIGLCVEKAKKSLQENGFEGEIIVADNGSDDGSKEIARQKEARVIEVANRGYGNAYLGGLKEARGNFLLIADSDDTYDFSEMPKFIEKLKDGYEFVNGNRIGNLWSLKSLPVIHRYFGAIILSGFLNVFFRTGLTDAHCGMRAFTKDAYLKMGLASPGMEFASEMLIRAKGAGLKTTEVEIKYNPRSEGSKLNPLGDGWRHIKTILRFYFQGVNGDSARA